MFRAFLKNSFSSGFPKLVLADIQCLTLTTRCGPSRMKEASRFFSDLPRKLSKSEWMIANKSWIYWNGRGLYTAGHSGWYGELRTVGWPFHSGYLSRYFLWDRPLFTTLRGTFWPTERWLLVTGVLRNSRNWVPSIAAGIMRPERWMAVATVISFNTIGSHIPRMTLLLLAQMFARSSAADTMARDSYFPLSRYTQTESYNVTSPLAVFALECWREMCIWWRLCSLVIYLLPLFLTYPLTSLGEEAWHWWLRNLRHTLETCGPAFIKWGQWASTRRDLFHPDVAAELRKLQIDSPAHSPAKSRETIEAAFGFSTDTLFQDFEDRPLASGSIGQVHRAKLSPVGSTITGIPVGTEVAIKVRHPHVDSAFRRDMNLMMWIAKTIDRCAFLKGFNLQEMICQFAAPMTEQVDLRMEAANLQCFRNNFRRNKRVIFPEPLFPLVTSDILVETYHRGNSIQDIIEQGSELKETPLAVLGSQTFFDMVVKHNLMHADLHPGNILVQYRPDNGLLADFLQGLSTRASKIGLDPFHYLLSRLREKSKLMPDIILLDAGMATQLNAKERYHMVGLFRSVANLDGGAAAEHTLSFAGDQQLCPDPDGFRKAILDHFEAISRPGWSEEDFVSSVDAFGRVIDIIREHRVVLPGQIVSCLFTVFILEGWATKLDPEHSVMDQIKDMVKKVDLNMEQRLKEGASQILINGLSNLASSAPDL